MSPRERIIRVTVLSIGTVLGSTGLALAGAHTWRVNEVYSNASGTVQFVELRETGGGAGETFLAGNTVSSNTRVYTIPSNLTPPTSFKSLLFATPGFVGLPGAPAPDFVFPAGSVPFFSAAGDSVRYNPYDSTFTFGAGVCPTDGLRSISRPGFTVGCNSPTNYAGVTGRINLGCALSGDVDNNGARSAADIAAFIRAKLGAPIGGDNPICAEYCTANLSTEIDAFIADLLQ